MEINILIGLYGSGKSTLISFLRNNNSFVNISLDELDIESRTNPIRIKIIFNLFKTLIKQQIDFAKFNEKYLELFSENNGSLANTLFLLYEIFMSKNIDKITKNRLREEVLIPSILKFFIEKIKDSKVFNKNFIVDTGAMHFVAMNKLFFNELNEFFSKINIIYLNNEVKQILSNLFCKNNGYFAFLERGFKKDIYCKILNNLYKLVFLILHQKN